MKIIDQTPFFNNETGEISILDRGKAMMKYGLGWVKDVEAQKLVLAVFDKVLDKNYTFLRNVTPPGLNAMLPLILVGPTGVYVMDVTPLTGMYRAKGNQWGTISGNTFKAEKTNLLTRTERMARAVQVYLQRQGYSDLSAVEAILLCSDPSIHVDSLRPVIRIVMRDALERFAISVTQARTLFSPESVQDIINRIINPPKPATAKSAEAAASAAPSAGQGEPTFQGSPKPASESVQGSLAGDLGFGFDESAATASAAPRNVVQPALSAVQPSRPKTRRRNGLNRKQVLLLVVGFIILCILIAAFAFLVVKDLYR
jgi:hypothetical protein